MSFFFFFSFSRFRRRSECSYIKKYRYKMQNKQTSLKQVFACACGCFFQNKQERHRDVTHSTQTHTLTHTHTPAAESDSTQQLHKIHSAAWLVFERRTHDAAKQPAALCSDASQRFVTVMSHRRQTGPSPLTRFACFCSLRRFLFQDYVKIIDQTLGEAEETV